MKRGKNIMPPQAISTGHFVSNINITAIHIAEEKL
jgi:hypothetical protein